MCLRCVADGKTERHHGPQPKPEPTFSPSLESSDVELAWAAGFFDGEGWSSRTSGGSGSSRSYVQVGVAQVDLRPLVRFQVAVDNGHISDTRRTRQWRASGSHAYRVMEKLWPFLSEPKREQFLSVLDKQEAA